MNNLLQKIFVVLAIALCGLCAYQWYFQTVQREAIEKRDAIIFQKSTDIQGYTNSMKDMDTEIAQLQARVNELKTAAASNDQAVILLKRDNARLESDNDFLTNEVVQYKAGVEKLETTLTNTYEGIKKQNAAIKELVDQRDQFVKKYNDSVKDRNDIVTKYNDVVDRLNKLQTAAPPAK
jgi:chromosome segregation ATPase